MIREKAYPNKLTGTGARFSGNKAVFPNTSLDGARWPRKFVQCINNQFLYYWFEFHASTIDDLGSGSTIKGISLADIKAIRFDLASLDEQTAIATILSDMDAGIAALEARRETRAQARRHDAGTPHRENPAHVSNILKTC